VARLRVAGLTGERAFLDTVLRLRRLADEPAAGAVLLAIDDLGLGLGRVEELRALVTALGRSKPVVAYLTQPTTRELYLASACGHVVVHPAGNVTLAGLQQVTTFYKGLLDRVGARVDLVRIAEYKGAMEPFVQDGPSQAVRENRDAVLDDDWSRLRAALVASRKGRGFDEARLDQVVATALLSPAEARAAGLVDAVADERELDEVVRQRLGKPWPIRDADATRRETGRWRAPRVAVILIEGAIVDGEGGGLLPSTEPLAWSERVIAALDQARSDPATRAVVLRVNSPGGDAFASDRIAREVARLRRSGKPVIVSMGDVAASGGYYVAAPGDAILAEASTITGSIGIFGYKVDVAGLLEQVGVTAHTTKRGERADLYSPLRAWTDDERAALLERLRHFYDLFLDTVVAGRKRAGVDRSRADELGRGRIWTGSQAQAAGLVDRLGGVGVAIDEAAARAGIPVGPGGLPELVVLPAPELDPLQALLLLGRLVSGDAEASDVPPSEARVVDPPSSAIAALAGGLLRLGAPAWRLLQPLLLSGQGVQARLPYDLEIR
jgi:protease-4